MFYSFPIEIPANTLEADRIESVVTLGWGVITYAEVEFPPRCASLAKIRVLHRRHQLWPTNPGGWFYTDGRVIQWDEYYELFGEPYQMIIQGYNTDDTYNHTPIVRINILPPLIAMMKYGGMPQYPQVRQIPWEEM